MKTNSGVTKTIVAWRVTETTVKDYLVDAEHVPDAATARRVFKGPGKGQLMSTTTTVKVEPMWAYGQFGFDDVDWTMRRPEPQESEEPR